MSDDDIMKIVDQYLQYDNGRDYYAYDYEDHWWGDREQILKFAKYLLESKA